MYMALYKRGIIIKTICFDGSKKALLKSKIMRFEKHFYIGLNSKTESTNVFTIYISLSLSPGLSPNPLSAPAGALDE